MERDNAVTDAKASNEKLSQLKSSLSAQSTADDSEYEERLAEALARQKSLLMVEHRENTALQQAEFDMMTESLKRKLEASQTAANCKPRYIYMSTVAASTFLAMLQWLVTLVLL